MPMTEAEKKELLAATDASTKAVLSALDQHQKSVNEKVDGVIGTVKGFGDRLDAIEGVQKTAAKERDELLQRLPSRGAAGAAAEIIHAAGNPADAARLTMNEQAKFILAGLADPAGVDMERAKALQIGIGPAGGFTIPTVINQEIILKATFLSVMLGNADIEENAALKGVQNREDGDFTWSSTPELAQPTETAFTDLLVMLSWQLETQAAFATVGKTFMRYSPMDAIGFLVEKASRSYQQKADDWFFNGTGSGEARGVRIAQGITSVAQAGASFDWSDLTELESALPVPYRGLGPALFLNDAGRKLIAKLATTVGEPIFMGTGAMTKLGMSMNYKAQSGVLNLPGGVSYPFFLLKNTALPATLGSGGNETEIWFGIPKMYKIWIGENMVMSQDSSGENWRIGQTQLKFETDHDGVVKLGEAWSRLTGVL